MGLDLYLENKELWKHSKQINNEGRIPLLDPEWKAKYDATPHVSIPYTSFHDIRLWIVKQLGIPTHIAVYKSEMIWDKGQEYEHEDWPHVINTPLKYLLNHSDCDGKLTPYQCKRMLEPLKTLIPQCNAEHIKEGLEDLYNIFFESVKQRKVIEFS